MLPRSIQPQQPDSSKHHGPRFMDPAGKRSTFIYRRFLLVTNQLHLYGAVMKRTVVVVGLLAMSGAAHAGLSFLELSTASRTEAFNVTNLPSFAVGTSLKLGTLSTDVAGDITFAYLGQESGYNNKFFLTIGPTQHLYESNPVGTAISAPVSSLGAVSFYFEGNTDKYAINGGTWDSGTSIGLIGTSMTVNQGGGAGTYDFVLGYDDSAGATKLGDWDDFVVGVKFTAAVSPAPEPEVYAMLGIGLGFLGWLDRGKKLKERAAA